MKTPKSETFLLKLKWYCVQLYIKLHKDKKKSIRHLNKLEEEKKLNEINIRKILTIKSENNNYNIYNQQAKFHSLERLIRFTKFKQLDKYKERTIRKVRNEKENIMA